MNRECGCMEHQNQRAAYEAGEKHIFDLMVDTFTAMGDPEAAAIIARLTMLDPTNETEAKP